MKKFILIGLLFIGLSACQDQEVRYTQDSKEINIVKKLIQDYNNQSYDYSMFSEASATFFNTKTDSMLSKDLIAYHKANDANYSSRGFLEKDQEFEMVITDDGETWVNSWLDWQGKLKGSNTVVDIPVHLTIKFEDGKIVRQIGMWDTSEVTAGLEVIAAQNSGNSSEDSDTNRPLVTKVSTINTAPKNVEVTRANEKNLSAAIAMRLRNPDISVNEDSKAIVRLTVNSLNQIVILGVVSDDDEVKEFIIKRLNYYHLDSDFDDKLTTYSVPITIIAE